MKRQNFFIVTHQLFHFARIPVPIEAKGIQWETKLSWKQIKAKAKVENKYIFIDCYATWCAPCKMMDKDVYLNDSVGQETNASYISVKVQMDSTTNDDLQTKSWYKNASTLKRKYPVQSFPSYLIFNPDGKIVHMGVGYKDVAGFIAFLKESREKSKQYFPLLKKFYNNKLDYRLLPNLALTAASINQEAVSQNIASAYISNYLVKLPKPELLSKKNVEFITRVYSVFQ